MIAAGNLIMQGFSWCWNDTAVRYFRIQLPINMVLLLTILLTSYLLIPTYGLIGAAWVSLIIFLVEIPLKGAVVIYALGRLKKR